MPRRGRRPARRAPLEDDPPRDDEDGDEPEAPRAVTNGELARIFHEIGDILEVKGELVFKTVAYHRAADAIARAPFDVGATYAAGERRPIPGVGQAIADKISELATTGRMAYYEKLRAEIPRTLVDLLRIPGVGPKTVRIVWEALGIADRRASSRRRRRAGCGRSRASRRAPRSASSRASRSSRRRRAGCSSTGRRPRATTSPSSCAVCPGVHRIVQAGSLRRRRESIGDLDLLVETADAKTVVERFTHLGVVDQVLGAGTAKAAVRCCAARRSTSW